MITRLTSIHRLPTPMPCLLPIHSYRLGCLPTLLRVIAIPGFLLTLSMAVSPLQILVMEGTRGLAGNPSLLTGNPSLLTGNPGLSIGNQNGNLRPLTMAQERTPSRNTAGWATLTACTTKSRTSIPRRFIRSTGPSNAGIGWRSKSTKSDLIGIYIVVCSHNNILKIV